MKLRAAKGKGNQLSFTLIDTAIPLQAWTGPEGSRWLRLPDFKKSAYEGGKVVTHTHRPPLLPGNIPSTHFG